MHVEESATPLLKKWIVKRLEDISDADSDVLADYVLALVKSDDPDDQVRATSLESLEDFLKDNTGKFVDDVFETIQKKTYDPSYIPTTSTAPAIPSAPSGPSFNPPAGPSADNGRRSSLTGLNGMPNGRIDQSRKRNFNQMAPGEVQGGRDSHYSQGGDRAIKQMRRGGGRGGGIPTGPSRGGGRGGDTNMGGMSRNPMSQGSSLPSMPTPPPGFPPLDPNNPLAAMMAIQQAMGISMPGFPPFPGAGSPVFGQSSSPPRNIPPKKVGQRCRDYDNKGYCALGTSCPYEHGPDSIMVGADEYDPTKPPAGESSMNGHGYDRARGSDRGRGRGRGRGDRNMHGKQRATFSQAGPNYDKSNTTIVVEQIPEEKFDEQIVREFFSEFGTITEIKMQAYKHLAVVTYEDYPAARKAYESPKVIFDNRFVKVYWYKSDSLPTPTNDKPEASAAESKPDEEMMDPAELEKKQAEAQKAHEEKLKQMEAAKAEREELDKKVKAQAEERKKLLEKLAAKTGGKTGSPAATGTAGSPAPEGGDQAKKSQNEALRAKLAELEAEAERIGLSPEEQYSPNYRGRGRGGYRGRGGFPPRGRGFDPYRGGYRGRGSFAGASRGGVMRLDNRPKKIVVTAPSLTSQEKDEAFRQYLFNNYEFENIEAHPDRKDSLIVAFKERYIAEQFINSASDIPQVGHTELSWHTAPSSALPTPAASTSAKEHGSTADINMAGEANGAPPTAASEDHPKAEMDYDVADDEDQWMAT